MRIKRSHGTGPWSKSSLNASSLQGVTYSFMHLPIPQGFTECLLCAWPSLGCCGYPGPQDLDRVLPCQRGRPAMDKWTDEVPLDVISRVKEPKGVACQRGPGSVGVSALQFCISPRSLAGHSPPHPSESSCFPSPRAGRPLLPTPVPNFNHTKYLECAVRPGSLGAGGGKAVL